MRFTPLAAALGALLATSAVMAQQHPYGVPQALPYPDTSDSIYTNAQNDDPIAPAPLPPGETGYQDGDVVYENGGPDDWYGDGGACCDSGWGGWLGNLGCGGCWYGRLSGLVMTAEECDRLWTSFDANNDFITFLGSSNAAPETEAGFEIAVGRRFGCNSRIEALWWTLEPMREQATYSSTAANINTPLGFGLLNLGGSGVDAWFNNAQAHRVARRSEFHNVELNYWRDLAQCDCCSPLGYSWMAGLRFFRYGDDFQFASSENAPEFGIDPANEAYYDVNINNNMIGAQIGGRVDYRCGCKWGVYAAPSIGLYNNHITHRSYVYSGIGEEALDIRSDKNKLATITQLDLGVTYKVGCSWEAFAAYRLMVASGVAVATAQVPARVDDIEGIQSIDACNSLFLHGAVVGIGCAY